MGEAGGGTAGPLTLICNKIHQVVDMEGVSTGKDAGKASLQGIVHHSAAGGTVHRGTSSVKQLILRDQPHGEHQGVTGDQTLCPRQGPAVRSHRGENHTGKPPLPLDLSDSCVVAEGDVEILHTLDNVPCQATGVRLELHHCQHLRPLQHKLASHNQPDVPGAQNHDPPAHQVAL